MSLEEKYEKYLDLFEKYFVYKGDPDLRGTNIPLQEVTFQEGLPSVSFTGDGTCNIAQYLLFSYLKKDTVGTMRLLRSLKRLSWNYFNHYQNNNPETKFEYEKGFFLRDDINSALCRQFKTNFIYSAWTGNIEGLEEDPCFSPVTSQDQIWNLLPVLQMLVKKDDAWIGAEADAWIYYTLKYVIDHGHTIYDPYKSTLYHNWTYLDLSVPYSERKKVRQQKLKYKIKVKRGANNWYYAYGFRKSFEKTSHDINSKFKSFLYSLIYYPLTFGAEKIWFPILQKLFGIAPKNNSYHCLASSSEIWFSGKKNFWKTLKKKFEKDGSFQDLYMIEVIKGERWKEVDLGCLEKLLASYQDPEVIGTIPSPLPYLNLWTFYGIVKNKIS